MLKRFFDKIPETVKAIVILLIFWYLVWVFMIYLNKLNEPIVEKKAAILKQAVSDIVIFDSDKTLDTQLDFGGKVMRVNGTGSFDVTQKQEEVMEYYKKHLASLGWGGFEHTVDFSSKENKSGDSYKFSKGNFDLYMGFSETDKTWEKRRYRISVWFIKDPQVE